MKKLVLILTAVLAISMITGCADSKNINGNTYTPYGWMEMENKDPCVRYKVNVPNVIWSVILVETLIARS